MNEIIFRVFNSLRQLTWPHNMNIGESKFNKESLFKILNEIPELETLSQVDQSILRRPAARPFFGWGATTKNSLLIEPKLKTDLTFCFEKMSFFIENKIVKTGSEDSIKNGLAQVIEYLNLYDVTAGILLIFDDGRGRDMEWENYNEANFIRSLTISYPLCIVRVRKGKQIKVCYDACHFKCEP